MYKKNIKTIFIISVEYQNIFTFIENVNMKLITNQLSTPKNLLSYQDFFKFLSFSFEICKYSQELFWKKGEGRQNEMLI